MADFAERAASMPPLVKKLLLDAMDPSSVAVGSLLSALGRQKDHAAHRM